MMHDIRSQICESSSNISILSYTSYIKESQIKDSVVNRKKIKLN